MSDWLIPGTVAVAAAVTAAWGDRTRQGLLGGAGCFSREGAGRAAIEVERSFVFADLVGFTAFALERGDVEAARVATRFQWAARRSLQGDAKLLKALGDGVMLAAVDSASAVATALELMRRVEADPLLPAVGVGLHRGNAVEIDGDFYGNAVNLAARLAGEARPAQMVCTEAAVASAAGAAKARPVGVVALKGIADEVVLYELVDRERAGGR